MEWLQIAEPGVPASQSNALNCSELLGPFCASRVQGLQFPIPKHLSSLRPWVTPPTTPATRTAPSSHSGMRLSRAHAWFGHCAPLFSAWSGTLGNPGCACASGGRGGSGGGYDFRRGPGGPQTRTARAGRRWPPGNDCSLRRRLFLFLTYRRAGFFHG